MDTKTRLFMSAYAVMIMVIFNAVAILVAMAGYLHVKGANWDFGLILVISFISELVGVYALFQLTQLKGRVQEGGERNAQAQHDGSTPSLAG